jgi:molybdopterin-containing oxidoreductase family iron-sulfur binding subunit
MQAELLQMYDPERSKTVKQLGAPSTWDAFNSSLQKEISKWKTNQGEGVRILTETITSPTLSKDFQTFLGRYPKARWHSYEPIHFDLTREATLLAFGQDLRPLPDFSKASIVLSLDADFLGPGPAQLAEARAFMLRRKTPKLLNRLYVVESSVSLTGASADHRLPIRPSEIYHFALALAQELGVSGLPAFSSLSGYQQQWMKEIAKDLRSQPGNSIVLSGSHLPSAVQALSFAINDRLGNSGKTLSYIESIDSNPISQMTSLIELAQDMDQGKVTTLIVLGANPVYQAPSSLLFGERLKKVPLRIRHGLYEDETSNLCQWHLPESHFLESWGDSRAFNGQIGLQQPLISPLYSSRSAIEILSILLEQSGRTAHQALQDYWGQNLAQMRSTTSTFERAIHDGVIEHSEAPLVQAIQKSGWISKLPSPTPSSSNTLETTLRPDPTLWDGRYANNSWLQELPKPILQLTWDNAVLISPSTATRLGLKDEDEVELRANGQMVSGPILRVPGHPDETITLTLGYGRSRAGKVGNHRGYDAFTLQTHLSPNWIPKIEIRKTGKTWPLAVTHQHQSMEGRDIVIRSTWDEFNKKSEKIIPETFKSSHPTSYFRDDPHHSIKVANKAANGLANAWAMVIDLTTCIGCKACTIACQAENNIPVVGKEQVRNSREMHWIRVDRYFEGDSAHPKIYFQPVPCMHCEKAPCELVCPTVATNHSTDGLNQMIYNRCVGTRYCSNNCPYKVRRFNFFQYSDVKTPSLQLMYNPNVTVRSRGVMEKCTYCVQRIEAARIEAEIENRAIRDGEVIPACAQACPTDAIIFGDGNDRESRVAKHRNLPQNYFLLGELGTQPRTSYLASLRNPNPAVLALKEEG